MNDISVYLIDDEQDFRESTSWLLESEGIKVNGYDSAKMFLNELQELECVSEKACILSDLRMPEMSGIELIEELRKKRIKLPLIMISGHADVPLVVKAMQSGVHNFLEKPFSRDQIIQSILRAVNDPVAGFRDHYASREKLKKLSPREKQVLDLVCQGKLNKTIADILGISVKTVELHRSNMVNKLDVKNVQDLVRLTLGHQY